jgi:hypothetical protein
MVLRVGLWNTRGAKPELRSLAKDVVTRLMDEESIDLLVLVEVKANTGTDYKTESRSVIEHTSPIGRSQWDIALIANNDSVDILDSHTIERPYGNRHLRIASHQPLEIGKAAISSASLRRIGRRRSRIPSLQRFSRRAYTTLQLLAHRPDLNYLPFYSETTTTTRLKIKSGYVPPEIVL